MAGREGSLILRSKQQKLGTSSVNLARHREDVMVHYDGAVRNSLDSCTAKTVWAARELSLNVGRLIPLASTTKPLSTSAGGPMSPSYHNRPFFPYRHAPTQEDLLFAVASAAQVQKESSQLNVLSQLNVNTSQLNVGGGGSKLFHVSHHSYRTQQSHVSHQSNHSHHTHQSQSRTRSLSNAEDDGRVMPHLLIRILRHSLNRAVEEMVAKALAARGAANRTSYAPSTLEPEIINSHFHDMDLCILLHQMDDNTTHEVVKKALRKALRQCMKKLGMKFDQEVLSSDLFSFYVLHLW